MDAAFNNLAEATGARNTLRAECTPRDLQQKEAVLAVAYRAHKQHRERAGEDVLRLKQGLERQQRRVGFTQDVEGKKRDADRLVYLESIVADVHKKELAAFEAWQKVVKELDDAYGKTTKEADEPATA